MLQVIGFADSDGSDHSLRIPVRIRHIKIGTPAGTAAPALACDAERALGLVSTALATIQGLELAAAPRSAAVSSTKCAPDFHLYSAMYGPRYTDQAPSAPLTFTCIRPCMGLDITELAAWQFQAQCVQTQMLDAAALMGQQCMQAKRQGVGVCAVRADGGRER